MNSRSTRRSLTMTALQPLEPLRNYITIVSDTDLRPATAWSAAEEGADHFRSSAVYLTASHPKIVNSPRTRDLELGTLNLESLQFTL